MKIQDRLLKVVTNSQDGKPKQIAYIIRNGDATGMRVTNNLNQLLADLVVRAAKTGDIEEAVDDLNYASQQLAEAARHLKTEFIAV